MRRERKTVSYRPKRSSRTSRSRKKNKNKKRLKLKLLLFVMSILLVSVLSFMAWRVWFYKPILTLKQTVWGEKLELDAALVFNTDIVAAPIDGILHQEFEEGGEVKAGQSIASVVNEEQEKNLKAKIETLKDKLSKFNITDNGEANSYLTGEGESLHNIVRNLTRNYSLYRRYKSVSGMNKSIKELDKVLASFYGTKEQTDKDKVTYQELKKELSIAETDYDHCKVDIITSISGIVSFKLDSFEQEITKSNFPLESHSWFLQKLDYSNLSDGDKVIAKQNIAKIVAKDKWWLIVRVPNKNSEEYLYSETFEVTIGENTFDAEYLTHVPEKKYIYFYYQISSDPVVFDRYNKVILASEQIECMEVPKEVIEKVEEKAYVYVKNGKAFEKVEVILLKELGNKVLITGLDEGTKILGDLTYIRR